MLLWYKNKEVSYFITFLIYQLFIFNSIAQRSISGNIDVQSNAVRVEYKQETFPSSFINDNTPVRQKPIKVHSFSEIKGIGPVTSRKLKSMKIFDSYDLANLTDEQCLQIKKTHHIYNIVSLRAIARELNNNSNNTN